MKLVKRELLALPLAECPGCTPEKDKRVILTAQIVEHGGGRLLVATYYNAKTRAPHCRLFLSEDGYITYLYGPGQWTKKSLESIEAPGGGQLNANYYVHVADKKSEQAALTFCKDRYSKSPAYAISNQQDHVRWNKQHASWKRREERRESVLRVAFRTLPPLPADFERWVLDVPLADAYLFYQRARRRNPLTGIAEPYYTGFCTACMAEHALDFMPQHKEYIRCPGCGREVQQRARGISRGRLVDSCAVAVRGRAGSAAYVRLFRATRDYRGEPEHVRTRFEETEVFYFAQGRAWHFTRYTSGGYGGTYLSDTWRASGKEGAITQNYWLYPSPEDVWSGTRLAHSQLDDYLRAGHDESFSCWPMDYLQCYLRYPAVESLMHAGLYRFVRERLNMRPKEKTCVDWSKKRPRAALGIPQADVAVFASRGWGEDELRAFKELQACGFTLEGDGPELVELFASHTNEPDKLRRRGITQSVRYLRHQRRRHYAPDTP